MRKSMYINYMEKLMGVQYIIDESGNKTGVFLGLNEYEELLERAEDVEALKMMRKMREKPLETRSFNNFLNDYHSIDA